MQFGLYEPNTTSHFVSHREPNVIDGNGDFSATQKVFNPTQTINIGKKIFIVDSRQRDCKKYPYPSNYRIELGDTFKNISSIELKGCILPKASYNIHSSNKYIDFSIGDTVTQINITNGGSGYLVAPLVTIDSPVSGITATATSTISARGEVDSITIVISGSGYSSSTPPLVTIAPPPQSTYSVQATAISVVGIHYSAELREGNYIVGGNPTPGTTTIPTDLVLELQNAMNYAVNGGAYDPASVSPFAVRIVSQYPELGATAGTPEASDTNACLFNRIQITNVASSPWEILWCSGPNSTRNLRRVLGFPWLDSTNPTSTTPIVVPSGTLIPGGTTLRSLFDYDMLDDPNYVILSFWAVADESYERVHSKPVGGLNRSFATLIYDSNNPENLRDLGGTTVETVGNVRYLVGDTTRGDFWASPGYTKPLKGSDFDQKILYINPPLGKVSYLNITFTKYGQKPGGVPEFYDFQGRDHMLMFEFTSSSQAGLVDT